MARKLKNWIESYLEYANHTESPLKMHRWTAVSVIAGALRRRVWIDQVYFQWSPGMYVIFVAPPGVVSKTTTIDIGMDLLKEIPGIKFGPDIVTWQAVVQTFSESGETFNVDGVEWPMSALNFASGELGNLLNPQDKEMVNLLITLWDGKKNLQKVTKGGGVENVEAPWINMIAATTPHWIADNMPAAVVGGGFTSRCVFVYADTKTKFIPYPKLAIRSDPREMRQDLLDDLAEIANLAGEFKMSDAAIEWGAEWYERVWSIRPETIEDSRLDGYVARKQTHLHKMAMVLSAARSDSLTIEVEDMVEADKMLTDMEEDLEKVFSRIGRTEESLKIQELLEFVKKRKKVSYAEAYRTIHSSFPGLTDFDNVVNGAVRGGYIEMVVEGTKAVLNWTLKGKDKSYNL